MARRDLYSVTRQFDLATMLTATAGFAVLFTVMRWLGASPLVIGLFSGLILTAAVAQALLFGGSDPRRASKVAGIVYCLAMPVFYFVVRAFSPNRGSAPWADLSEHFCFLATCALFGVFLGYIAGVLAAGVFLVTDYVRRVLDRSRRDADGNDRSSDFVSPWDEDES